MSVRSERGLSAVGAVTASSAGGRFRLPLLDAGQPVAGGFEVLVYRVFAPHHGNGTGGGSSFRTLGLLFVPTQSFVLLFVLDEGGDQLALVGVQTHVWHAFGLSGVRSRPREGAVGVGAVAAVVVVKAVLLPPLAAAVGAAGGGGLRIAALSCAQVGPGGQTATRWGRNGIIFI